MSKTLKKRYDKSEKVTSLKDGMQNASVALVVDHTGLSVAEITELRRELYKNSARLTVVKNTLMRKALKGTDYELMTEFLAGPTSLAIGMDDQIAPIKILKDYFKKNKKKNDIRGGVMDGKALSAADVDALSQLPSLDELRGKLVGGIASPLTGLVAALSGPQRSLVNVLDQYAKQKQSQEA